MPKINCCGAPARRKQDELLRLLKGSIYLAGGVPNIAPLAGMSATTLYARLKAPDDFSIGELRRLCKAASIDLEKLIPLLPLV